MKANQLTHGQRFKWPNQVKWRTFSNAHLLNDKDSCQDEHKGKMLVAYRLPNGRCGTAVVDPDFEFKAGKP
jgi:hypothetical protein